MRRITRGTFVTVAGVVALACSLLPEAARAAGSVYVTNLGGNVSEFGVGPTGLLAPLTPATVAAGMGPAGIALSPDGRSAYVSDGGESTVFQFDVNAASGTLSPKTPASVESGGGPIHSGIVVTSDGKNAYVTNFNDNSVSQYSIEATTGLLSAKTPATVASAEHPLDIAVTPDGKSAYVTNTEADTVSQYDINPTTGGLSPKTPATVAADFGAAGIAVTPDGKSVYVKNAGSISQYDINPTTGALSPKSPATVASGSATGSGDKTPIAASPDGKSVYAASGGAVEPSIFQYDVDSSTGKLTPKSPATAATGSQPENLAITPGGKSLYVTNTCGEYVSQYNVDPLTGALSAKSPGTVTAGEQPLGIAAGAFPLAHATETTVSCSPSTIVAAHTTTCTATVKDTASSERTTPTGTVSFTSSGPGSFESAGSCTLGQESAGVASCQLGYTPSATTAMPVRTDSITAAYGGDYRHNPSSGSGAAKVLSITLLERGSFVIGDQNAAVGSAVTFWSAQWSKVNVLSGGRAPSGLQGLRATTSSTLPSCGAGWSTGTGGSPVPPEGPLPAYMAVIASSKISQSGSTIFSGNTVHVVVVKTNPGYAPEPEHTGTGSVVGVVC